MPRLNTLLSIALAVAIASCSSPDRSAASSLPEESDLAVTTTSGPTPSDGETTTTSLSTTTTMAPTTTTTFRPVEAPPAAPTNALESFQWEFSTSIGASETSLLSLSSSGTYVDGDIECRIVAGFGGFDFETGAILVDEQAYLDAGDGDGYGKIDADDPAFEESLALCAGSERFWADMTGGEDVPAGGESEERNGIETRRLDLTGLIDQAGALGLVAPGVEGVSFDELTFWVAADGGWITSIVMNATLDQATLESITGSTIAEPGHIDIALDVTSANDPGLSVLAP